MGNTPVITIDTLKIAKELEKAGVPTEQAEAQTRVYTKIINHAFQDKGVTQQDFIEFERKIENRITKFENKVQNQLNNVQNQIHGIKNQINDIKSQINNISKNIMLKLGSGMVASVLVLAALIKL